MAELLGIGSGGHSRWRLTAHAKQTAPAFCRWQTNSIALRREILSARGRSLVRSMWYRNAASNGPGTFVGVWTLHGRCEPGTARGPGETLSAAIHPIGLGHPGHGVALPLSCRPAGAWGGSFRGVCYKLVAPPELGLHTRAQLKRSVTAVPGCGGVANERRNELPRFEYQTEHQVPMNSGIPKRADPRFRKCGRAKPSAIRRSIRGDGCCVRGLSVAESLLAVS